MSNVTLSETGIPKPKNKLKPIIETTSSMLFKLLLLITILN